MKKTITIALLLSSYSLADLSWEAPLVNLNAVFGIEAGWFVQMYQDVDNDSDLTSITFDLFGAPSDTDDSLMSGFSTLTYDVEGGVIQFNDTFSGWEGTYASAYVYTVVYNAATIGESTEAMVFNNSGSRDRLGAADPYTYLVNNSSNGWQAVPEPASMALIGLGGVLVWLSRLKQRWS